MGDPTTSLHVDTLIVKVASRCNLNCSYCYVYNLGDDSWRAQPRVMSTAVVHSLMVRVREHCARHGLERFSFIFHGGEPLLCGPQFFVDFVAAARAALSPTVMPSFVMQTNGTLLSDDWCRLLDELDIGYGISLDGPEAINDRYRVDHAGRGSYRDVRAGIEAAQRRPGGKVGVLTVIDVEADPIACYEHLKELDISTVDFLLPDATYDKPPPVRGETVYADWLIAIFDRWFAEKPLPIRIRIFEEIIGEILGAPSTLDCLGAARNELLVIETDGGIEPLGILNICAPGFTKVGANVATHALDDALATELARAYQLSGSRLCATCASCPVGDVCGGGYLPHRYGAGNGFDNPSVYCDDLLKLITHIQNAVVAALPDEARRQLGLAPLTFADARSMRLPPPSRARGASLPVLP